MDTRTQRARAGFTLVEVALAVAVGLIIIGGAVAGYGAVKDNAASSAARERVNLAGGMIAEFSAANNGLYPPSVAGANGGSFTAMWKAKRPDDYNTSPWGGQTGDANDGVDELAPISNGTNDPATAPDDTALASVNGAQAANLIYASINNSYYAKFQQASNPDAYLAKGYVLSIYDRTGAPWFHLNVSK
jgi:prepilin-type N-terminal cleavage/methylation domain-containing protein